MKALSCIFNIIYNTEWQLLLSSSRSGDQDPQQNKLDEDNVRHGIQFIILNVNLVYIDNRLCVGKQQATTNPSYFSAFPPYRVCK